jgi:LCP family protein required for cell wall assembly
MSVLLPGSAQVAAGSGSHRQIGRLALRIWAAGWVLLLLAAVFALVWRGAAIAALTAPATLRALEAVLIAGGLGWSLLILDAWRLAPPVEMARRHRVGLTVLTGALVLAIVGGAFASASVVSAQRDLVASVFAGGGDHRAKAGRYNILLMGGDAGKDRVGLRPDSLTLASIDATSGRTVLISLPRNLENVPFPASSPLHARFPSGYGCPDHSCMLNAVYTYAMGQSELYPGFSNPGAEATREAVEGVTGLEINYWALIDLKGFQALVDAVGGITLDVNRDIPIGGGEAKLYGYVTKGKHRHLDGREALWFARSRSDSSDYDRMARQKCVMNAMLNQLDPVTVLTNFNKIAAAGKQIVATDIPTSQLDVMIGLALKARQKPISSLSFVPPLINPANADFAQMRDEVAAKIAGTPAARRRTAAASAGSPAPAGTGNASGRGSTTSTTAPNTDNLGAVC